MARNRTIAALLTAALLTGCLSGCTPTPPATPIAAEETLASLQSARVETTDMPAPTLLVGGMEAIFETEEQCYYASVTDDAEWGVLPLELPDDEGKTAVFAADFSAQRKSALLRKNEPIPVMIYDSESYQLYDLKFSSLPLLAVETKELPASLHYFDEGEEEEEPVEAAFADEDPIGVEDTFASVRLLDPLAQEHGYEPNWTSDARLHIRGRSSREYPKHNYKLELLEEDAENPGALVERDLPLLGMRSDGDWVLGGMYAEPTKLRDMAAANVWLAITADREAKGDSTGFHLQYVELFINGQYRGLYFLGERIDKKQLGLSKGDRMYFSEGDTGKWYTDFLNLDNDRMVRRGYELRYPKTRKAPYDEWQPFSDLVYLIDNADNQTFKAEAAKMIDFDSIIDYWIFVQTASAVDNLIQNTYYAAYKQEDGSYQYQFVPWDFDQTFGNRWAGEPPLLTAEDYNTSDTEWSFWITDRLLRNNPDDFRTRLRERYETLRKTVISDDALMGYIEDAQTAVHASGAFERNRKCWPDGGYQDDLTELRRYVRNRMAWLDSEVKTL